MDKQDGRDEELNLAKLAKQRGRDAEGANEELGIGGKMNHHALPEGSARRMAQRIPLRLKTTAGHVTQMSTDKARRWRAPLRPFVSFLSGLGELG